MSKRKMQFQSADEVGAHVVREEQTAVLDHTPAATSILFGKFMLDRPRPAGPRPEPPKK